MAIRFPCTQCKKWLSIAARKAGSIVQCPICTTDQNVPTESLWQSNDISGDKSLEIPIVLIGNPPVESFQESGRAMPTTPGAREGNSLPLPHIMSNAPRGRGWVFGIFFVLGFLVVVGAPITLAVYFFYRADIRQELMTEGPASPVTPVLPVPEALQQVGDKNSPLAQPSPVDSAPSAKEKEQIKTPTTPAISLPDNKKETAEPIEKVPVVEKSKSDDPAKKEPASATTAPLPVKPKLEDIPKKEPLPSQVVAKEFKRRSNLTDEDLRKHLFFVPEVTLDTVPGSGRALLIAAKASANPGLDLAPMLMKNRSDLAGLPVKIGIDCRLSKETAENLQALSRKLRQHLEKSIPGARFGSVAGTLSDPRPDPQVLRTRLLGDVERSQWLRPEAIPTLLQLLMAENRDVRHILVDLLSEIPGPQASQSLAKRALFDLHHEVRQAAVEALKRRAKAEYLEVLLQGFHYPWFAVSDHAAEALVHLDCRETLPKLVVLLDAKDANRPAIIENNNQNRHVVHELVRVNHLSNCLMCHAPSLGRGDLVRGRVPIPGQPLPAPVTTPQYYEGNQGTFVRADITYLFQDFSVHQPANNFKDWPAHQRFDYMIRRRPLTPLEWALLQKQDKAQRGQTQRKEAILFAVRELSQENLTQDNWRDLFDPISGDKVDRKPQNPLEQARRITAALVDAKRVKQEELLSTIREREGDIYDLAILMALKDLPIDLQPRARKVLAERFADLPLEILRIKLHDANREVRLAAVSACAYRELKSLADDVAPLSRDPDSQIADEAERVRSILDPDYAPDKGVQRLAKQLIDAPSQQQKEIFDNFRKSENTLYLKALAKAIPDLPAKLQIEARDHLALRFAAGSLESLVERFTDENTEVRLAAVKACRAKGIRSLIPHLIPRLNDREYVVVAQSREALEHFTNRNIGPYKDASPAQRREIMLNWKEWWGKNMAN